MNFVILGDKFQKRMKSKGCIALLKPNHKTTIIQQQYINIKNIFPKSNIVYVYGFEAKKFCNFISKNHQLKSNLISIHNSEYEKYNSVYSLYLAQEYLDDECCILFGENMLNSHLFDKFDKSLGSQIFVNKKNKNKLGCIINDTKIENISYDLDNYLCEIYYLTKDHSAVLKNLIQDEKYHNYFVFEIFNKLIDHIEIKPFFTTNRYNYNYVS